ncbi:MAG: PAS domain S-box protein [Deltaproteobacteria bacterium]|nr:PAS domain S-box protein [Deltaproteobacteria bacterium]
MVRKPTYEELEQRVKALEKEAADRAGTQEALRESEEKCRLTFESAVDAIFWADSETGLVTNCNRAAETLLEKSREEIIGQHQTTLHPPDKAEYYTGMFKKHIEQNGSVDEEGEIITKSGRIIPVHITASVTLVRAKPIIQGTFRDIAERRRVEEELREGEEKYSTLVESSLTGIYIDQDEKVVFANNTFAEIYRYPRDALMGMETWKLVHPEDRALTDDMRARRLRGEDVPVEYEARGLTKFGGTIWIKRRNTRIEYQGKPAILGNIADITEQKGAEEKLRKINEELENFVHVVSHDLKTPIISIQGFSSRLFKKRGDKMEAKERKYLEQIRTSADRMELLVSDLLSLSKVGRVVSTFKEVSSLEIVTSTASSLRDRVKKNEIELVVGKNLPTIYCDGERIYQVFENLLGNAVKFVQGTGNPKIEIGYEEKGAFHQFHVKDNGIGIDPKYHRKIFEMFHRLKEVKDQEGSGLGLAIVARIIDHHGGKVWVESEKAKGATFYFTLPRKP